MTQNPLSNADYNTMTRGLAAVAEGLKKCDLAEAIGLPCDEERARFNILRERFTKAKEVYFPDRK
jgi:hypothetical protein